MVDKVLVLDAHELARRGYHANRVRLSYGFETHFHVHVFEWRDVPVTNPPDITGPLIPESPTFRLFQDDVPCLKDLVLLDGADAYTGIRPYALNALRVACGVCYGISPSVERVMTLLNMTKEQAQRCIHDISQSPNPEDRVSAYFAQTIPFRREAARTLRHCLRG